MSAWGTDEASAVSPCGHCDNCTRPPESICRKDVTLEAWRILRVADTIEQQGGRVTLGMMGDLVRGVGGGSFGVSNGGRGGNGKSKEKIGLDLESISNGKTSLSKDVSVLEAQKRLTRADVIMKLVGCRIALGQSHAFSQV